MSSRRYHRALNRQQDMLLPLCIDDYVSQNNPVRSIDAYVDTLDLYALGFKNTEPVIGAGQPAYDPAALLKLYLYGYLQGIRSSRKLERETTRNLEVMWLIAGLQPTYQTIADFRKDNSDALKAANRDFLLLCKEFALFGGEQVAVDGSFFIERHRQRMEQQPGIMKKRVALVEHPFGTLKHRAGMNHFLMRGLEKCRGEFSLMVLTYNFTRLLAILGADMLRDYCARRPGNTLKNVEYA